MSAVHYKELSESFEQEHFLELLNVNEAKYKAITLLCVAHAFEKFSHKFFILFNYNMLRC